MDVGGGEGQVKVDSFESSNKVRTLYYTTDVDEGGRFFLSKVPKFLGNLRKRLVGNANACQFQRQASKTADFKGKVRVP